VELVLELVCDYDFDFLTDEDLKDLEIARKELADGEAVKWSDINWK
jgi:hypothetical protein